MEIINPSTLNALGITQLKNVNVHNFETKQLQRGNLSISGECFALQTNYGQLFDFYADEISKIVANNGDVTIFVYHWYEENLG